MLLHCDLNVGLHDLNGLHICHKGLVFKRQNLTLPGNIVELYLGYLEAIFG